MKRVFSVISIISFLLGAYLFTRPENIGSNLTLFYAGFVICALGYIGILVWKIPFAKKYWLICFWILVIIPRLLALNMLPSDDLDRYLWEGRVLLDGYSPYSYPPDSDEFIQYRDSEIYDKISHKDKPAIYPPLAQYIFAFISLFVKDVYALRLVILLAEIIVIMIILAWLGSLNLPRERVLIYALNPLVIIGIAGHGHLDPLQLLFLMFGLFLYSKGRVGLCLALITLAGMIKFLALAAIPFLITRKTVKYLPVLILPLLACYLPLLLLKGNFSFGNLGIFLGSYEFYSLSFAPLRLLFGTAGALWISIAVIALSGLGLWLTRTNPLQSIVPIFFIITLMSTTVHYWYLIPVLAVAVVWPQRYLIALSLLFLPYFDVFGLLVNDNIWRGALWRQIATYTPFIILFWIEMTGRWPVFRKKKYSIGTVIPVLNDAESLKKLLDSLSKTNIDRNKVVISDGGSDDNSLGIAEEWGARVLRCEIASRGSQIARGIDELDVDLIVILHADNEVDPELFAKIVKTASAYPYSAGGACRLIYKQKNLRMRLLSYLSNIKMSLFGASFGDQGQWFRKGTIEFPEIPLMEDVEFALRLNNFGIPVWTRARVYVSTRRYKKVGLFRGAATVVNYTLSYLFKRRWNDEPIDTTDMYKKYYGLKS
jgi:hypothetical protein